MSYIVSHDGDLSEMPEWWKWWSDVLRPQQKARSTYIALIKPEYEGPTEPIPESVLKRSLGLTSTFELQRSLQALEDLKFLEQYVDEDEGVVYITVGAPPQPTPAEEERYDIGANARVESANQAADEFLKMWKRNWETAFAQAYIIRPADRAQAARLAKMEPDWKEIRNVITFFWDVAHDGENKYFSAFVAEYAEYAAEMARFKRSML